MNEKAEGAEQVGPQRHCNTLTAAPNLNVDTGAGLHLVHSLQPGHDGQQAYRLVVAKTLVADRFRGRQAHWPRD